MSKFIPIFKSWVPDWLIKVILFIVLLPSMVLFFLPLSNVNAAAGHYGCEPYDIQFAVVLFYVGYTASFRWSDDSSSFWPQKNTFSSSRSYSCSRLISVLPVRISFFFLSAGLYKGWLSPVQ